MPTVTIDKRTTISIGLVIAVVAPGVWWASAAQADINRLKTDFQTFVTKVDVLTDKLDVANQNMVRLNTLLETRG